MKKLKKLAGILLALVIVFSMTATAYAAEQEVAQEVVNNTTTHSYAAYQIFSGTQATGSAALGAVEWGSGMKSNASNFLTALQNDGRFVATDSNTNIFASCKTAADVAAVLGNYGDKSDVANAFANVAVAYVTGASYTVGAEGTVTLPVGYYLLKDTTVPTGSDAKNSALLQVTNDGPITIEGKYSVPTVEKKVTGSTTGSASYEIGESVPFTLTGTMPDNLSDYETYKYSFTDTMSKNLKYNNNVAVYVRNGEDKTLLDSSKYNASHTGAETNGGGGTLTVSFVDMKKIDGVDKESKIIVEYSAELLSTAESGNVGNSNKVKLTYSNDPNTQGSETTSSTETTEESVKVFTYTLKVNKVSGNDAKTPLKGAKFVLWNSDKSKVATVTNGTLTEWGETTTESGKVKYPAGAELTSDDKGEISIKGLKAATYYLEETEAPAGYNQLEDRIELVISENLTTNNNKVAELNSLSMKVKDENDTDTTSTLEEGNTTTGVVSTNVENKSGATLPETGGMGTTLFYIVGAALALSAVVLLVTKKRMSGAEK